MSALDDRVVEQPSTLSDLQDNTVVCWLLTPGVRRLALKSGTQRNERFPIDDILFSVLITNHEINMSLGVGAGGQDEKAQINKSKEMWQKDLKHICLTEDGPKHLKGQHFLSYNLKGALESGGIGMKRPPPPDWLLNFATFTIISISGRSSNTRLGSIRLSAINSLQASHRPQ